MMARSGAALWLRTRGYKRCTISGAAALLLCAVFLRSPAPAPAPAPLLKLEPSPPPPRVTSRARAEPLHEEAALADERERAAWPSLSSHSTLDPDTEKEDLQEAAPQLEEEEASKVNNRPGTRLRPKDRAPPGAKSKAPLPASPKPLESADDCSHTWRPHFPRPEAKQPYDYLDRSGILNQKNRARMFERVLENVDQRVFPESGKAIINEYCKEPGACKPSATGADGSSQLLWHKCAVVGNAGHLLYSTFQRSIDRHNIVWRLNQAPTANYTKHVGEKTTHRLLNRVWTLAYSMGAVGAKFKNPAVHSMERGVKLVSSRTALENYEALRLYARANYTDKRVEVLKLMQGPVTAAQNSLQDFANCIQKRNASLQLTGGFQPSSGLVATALLSNLCEKITVYGIGPANLRYVKTPYQYYTLVGTERGRGNVVHSFQGELLLFWALAKAQVITLCGYRGCVCGTNPDGTPFKVPTPNDEGAKMLSASERRAVALKAKEQWVERRAMMSKCMTNSCLVRKGLPKRFGLPS